MRSVKAINLSASQSEAENLVAKIWIALAKHGLSSPKMTVLFRPTKLEIKLLFESRRAKDLIRAELPRAMVRKIQAVGAMVALEPELYATTLGDLAA